MELRRVQESTSLTPPASSFPHCTRTRTLHRIAHRTEGATTPQPSATRWVKTQKTSPRPERAEPFPNPTNLSPSPGNPNRRVRSDRDVLRGREWKAWPVIDRHETLHHPRRHRPGQRPGSRFDPADAGPGAGTVNRSGRSQSLSLTGFPSARRTRTRTRLPISSPRRPERANPSPSSTSLSQSQRNGDVRSPSHRRRVALAAPWELNEPVPRNSTNLSPSDPMRGSFRSSDDCHSFGCEPHCSR